MPKRINSREWVKTRRLRAYFRRKGRLPWRIPPATDLLALWQDTMIMDLAKQFLPTDFVESFLVVPSLLNKEVEQHEKV